MCDLVMNVVVLQKYVFELESELTSTQHVTHEKYNYEVETMLPLNVRAARSKNDLISDWTPLSTHTAEENTRWKVRLERDHDDVQVVLKRESLDQMYSVATVRLYATVVDNCHNWTETATVVSSDDKYYYSNKFSKRLSQFGGSTQVSIRVRWTRVELSPRAVSYLMSGTARVQCRWRLCGLNTVRPTAECWDLWSEPFGSGAMWRMCVHNSRRGSGRRLRVSVYLQHICETMQQQQLQWSCTLKVSKEQFEDKKNMKKRSVCGLWTVVDDVDKQPTDTLNLQLLISVTHRQKHFSQ